MDAFVEPSRPTGTELSWLLQVGVPEASFDFWAAKVRNQVPVLEFLAKCNYMWRSSWQR